MITIRHERPSDAPEREALLDLAFGACRFEKTSERLRRGQRPAAGLSFVATAFGRVVGTVRLWHVAFSSPPPERGRPACSAGRESRAAPDPSPDHLRWSAPPLSGEGEDYCVSSAAGRPALLLGPLATHPDWRARGVGAALMRRALAEAERRGHGAVLLVGDAPYYGRFGFSSAKTGPLAMPGPCEPHRLLACELRPGALDGAHGVILPPPASVLSPHAPVTRVLSRAA